MTKRKTLTIEEQARLQALYEAAIARRDIAKERLVRTQNSVSELAEQLGFKVEPGFESTNKSKDTP